MIEDIKVLIPYAFRYALGRSTYAPDQVSNIIMKHIEHIDTFMLEQFIGDIERAIDTGTAGQDCDVDQWFCLSVLLGRHIKRRELNDRDKPV